MTKLMRFTLLACYGVLWSLKFSQAQKIQTSCGENFCEHSSAYPIVPEIQRILASDRSFAPLKEALTRPRDSTTTSKLSDDDPLLPREGPNYQICRSDVDIVFPQEAINTRGQRKFIINFGPFAQSVTIERCRPEAVSFPCNYVGVPPDYTSTCVQKEMDHRLTTIESDPTVGSVQTSVDVFRFPSYCNCQLVKGGQRFAAPLCAAPGLVVAPQPSDYFVQSPYSADDANIPIVRKSKPAQESLGLTPRARTVKKRPWQDKAPSGGLSSRTLDLFAQ